MVLKKKANVCIYLVRSKYWVISKFLLTGSKLWISILTDRVTEGSCCNSLLITPPEWMLLLLQHCRIRPNLTCIKHRLFIFPNSVGHVTIIQINCFSSIFHKFLLFTSCSSISFFCFPAVHTPDPKNIDTESTFPNNKRLWPMHFSSVVFEKHGLCDMQPFTDGLIPFHGVCNLLSQNQLQWKMCSFKLICD